MRNIVEHPITIKEIVDCLDEIAKDIRWQNEDQFVCGDMRPLLLAKAKEIILNATQITPL